MFIVVTVVFLIVRVTPGDPAAIMLGPDATAAEVAALRDSLGLNQPILVQYVLYFGELLSGDLGQIDLPQQARAHGPRRARRADPVPDPVRDADRCAIAVPIGILAAYRRGSAFDQVVATLAMMSASIPSFWLGLVAQQMIAVKLGHPAGGRLRAARRRFLRAHAAPDPAGRGSGCRQLGADLALHPRQHARRAQRRLCPHRQGQGPERIHRS